MIRILAVSPHLDDAVFSAGATLAEHAAAGARVTVATCFTGNVARPTGFALACQLDKGLGPEVDYMALRRREDVTSCNAIGAAALHLPFLEAPHRGYESAAELFGDVRPDDDAGVMLKPALRVLLDRIKPDIVYGPYGVGGHVDHLVVREALQAVLAPSRPILWEDYPYAMKEGAPPADIERVTPGTEAAERKLSATLAYESQLDFQFGGADAARVALADWRHEGFCDPSAGG